MPGEGDCILRIGPYRIAIAAGDPDLARRIRRYFAAERDASGARADLRLRIEVVPDPCRDPVPVSLLADKRVEGRCFRFHGDLVRGTFDAERGAVEVRVRERLLCGRPARIFEQLLYQAFYTVALERGDRAVLLHAAGALRGGGGLAFAARSGVGKTTLARLGPPGTVLNDEICAVFWRADGPWLAATPFNGFFRDKVRAEAPLRAIFLLEQGPRHRAVPLSPGEAAFDLYGEIVPPVGILDAWAPPRAQAMADAAGRLAEGVPCFRLAFAPDAGVWEAVDAAVGAQGVGGEGRRCARKFPPGTRDSSSAGSARRP